MSEVTAVTERRKRTRKLCAILTRHVSKAASPGLGHWPPAWELVEDVSGRLLDALADYERTGDEADMDRAKQLTMRVLAAWKEADRRYRGTGCSGNRQEIGT